VRKYIKHYYWPSQRYLISYSEKKKSQYGYLVIYFLFHCAKRRVHLGVRVLYIVILYNKYAFFECDFSSLFAPFSCTLYITCDTHGKIQISSINTCENKLIDVYVRFGNRYFHETWTIRRGPDTILYNATDLRWSKRGIQRYAGIFNWNCCG
jgi:hypothetical protein